ncbi:MAG TPA: N-acetylmuramoyl-L-alanine amidase, partial [Acidobacteriaceae bacterium]|nr:N-acetylmuramoyl-L-alanine amidase [Acidobacteriaceae bacterium]
MRWIRERRTKETKRLRLSSRIRRFGDWVGESNLTPIGILIFCVVSAACGQQSTQEGNQTAATPSSTASQQPAISHPHSTPSNIPAATPPSAPELRFLVLLDPAHGGTDTGAMLDPATLEKDYTLALAMQLRLALNARGIRSILTRTSDVEVDSDARATTANHSHASACLSLHATSTGNGVHLFTSSLPATTKADPRRAFLPWQTAQAAYETSSLRLESDVDAA